MKYSLINEQDYNIFKEGDVIRFEMPSFTSGEYLAKVKHDKSYGFYIDMDSNFFNGCRDYDVFNINDVDCPDWIKEEYKKL